MDEQTQLLKEIRDAVREHKALYEERIRGILKTQTLAIRLTVVGIVLVLIAFVFVGFLAVLLIGQMR